MTCIACGGPTRALLNDWLTRCTHCGLRRSRLDEARFNGATTTGWDPATVEAMAGVRERDALALLDRLAAGHLLPAGRQLLDVGCGPGWFVRAAAARGFDASGIEPDDRVAGPARAAGLAVTTGRFPEDCAQAHYDVITFNDVFEHLPDPAAALAATRERLAADGRLVLNLPSARGIFLRTAELLARGGITTPLDRLWQRGFDSPHLFYFTPDALDALLARHGFTLAGAFDLAPLSARGLWGRIRAGGQLGVAGAAAVYAGAMAAMPLLGILPSDIMVRVYRPA